MSFYQVTIWGRRVYRHWDYRRVAEVAFRWGLVFPTSIKPCH